MRFIKLTLISVITFYSIISSAQENHDFEISKNLDIYTSLIQQLNLHYVDEIKPTELTTAGINAMLKQIDPYTVFYPEVDNEDVVFLQTGHYGGIGASLHVKNNEVVVEMTFPNFPFYNAGIRAGDILLSIDGQEVNEKSYDKISEKLRGVAGSTLNITYRSLHDGKEHNVTLTRQNIEIKNVPYFGMMTNNIAYVKLTGFTENAGKEVLEALDSLSKNNKIESVILDLRDNGGGLLSQAVEIMNIFVNPNEVIVSTKGKTKNENNIYKTTNTAKYSDVKLAVLTNENTASASEIVAGATQDLDRGIIAGQKTYGKGLVQKIFPLSYRTQVKITVAKYYIPSGRCIQKLDYNHKDNNGNATQILDSLSDFKTKNGRIVKDAGGVTPDTIYVAQEYPDVLIALLNKYVIFDFATQYCLKNDSIKKIKDFKINDDIYNSFLDFTKKDSFNYTNAVDIIVKNLKNSEIDYKVNDEIKKLQQKNEENKKLELIANKEIISSFIKQEIASRYYFLSGKIEAETSSDNEIKKTIELLSNNEEYNKILKK